MFQMITNPATLVPLGEVPESGIDAVERAVAAAQSAAGSWRATPAVRRAALLKEIAGRIRAEAQGLVELSTRESGLARCESLDCVRAAAACFDFFAADAVALPECSPDLDDAPGVAAVLIPFDLPLPVMAAGVARALAAGHSVVCKPPVQNPLTCLALARTFEGLPDGAVAVVTGGPAVGRALVVHPGIGEVAFTGSSASGLQIGATARGKRLDLEAGSVDAQIVCRDADLDLTVPAVAWTRLVCGGQGRMAGGHLYVERSLAREFVDRLHQCVGFLDVDDPDKPSTDLGPLISLDAARKLEDQVGRTLRAGAKLILGGRRFRPSGLPGHFFQPTIMTDVAAGGVPMREQLLGPVITVTPVTDLAEALRIWTEFSPRPRISPSVASIYTADAEAAGRSVQAIADATFRINDPSVGDLGPFSGLRHGGIRHALGADRKRVEIAHAIERKPWWFPYVDRARPL
jgi:acyl-CoA reductase-like NAD-dependent aldehyde dehydrogenase